MQEWTHNNYTHKAHDLKHQSPIISNKLLNDKMRYLDDVQ